MKRYIKTILPALLMLLFFACSESDDTPTEPGNGNGNGNGNGGGEATAAKYYPGEVGSKNKYEGEIKENESSQGVPTERNSTYTSEETREETVYIKQANEINIAGTASTPSNLFFRRSDNGVYIYINSQIFEDLLDSLGIDPGDISFTVDPEITLLAYPFPESEWAAFKVNIKSYSGISFPGEGIAVVELTAVHQGQEELAVEATGENMTAEKIVYTGKVGLPSELAVFIPDFPSLEVQATAWYVENVGLVKTEGSAFILGAISGGNIDLSDSTTVITETLVESDLVVATAE